MRYCFFVIAVVVEFIFSAVSKSEEEEEEAEDEEGFGKSIKGGVVRVIQERTVERWRGGENAWAMLDSDQPHAYRPVTRARSSVDLRELSHNVLNNSTSDDGSVAFLTGFRCCTIVQYHTHGWTMCTERSVVPFSFFLEKLMYIQVNLYIKVFGFGVWVRRC